MIDKRDNPAPEIEQERTRNRAIRSFRLPSILELPSPQEDDGVSFRPLESIRVADVTQARDQAAAQETVLPEIDDELIREEVVIVEQPVMDDDQAEREPERPLSPTMRRPRKFWIDKKIAPEKDEERPERSGKKSIIPLRYKSLEEAMGGLRDFHPLPSELILRQAPHHSTWLMTQINNVNTKNELEELADSLSYKDLSLLFTTLSTKKRRSEVDQIMNLIRLRASHYLYLCGWLTFQYCYPRSSVSRALSDLCTILEDLAYVRENRLQRKRFRREPLALPVVSVGKGRIIWSRVPLISQISLPNSRHFIADIATEMIESKVDPAAFFEEYAIIPGEPLADAIEVRYNEMVTGVAANPLLSSDFFDRFRR